MSLCGVFLLNKPVGIRSSVCVAALKRQLGRKVKVGHGGALDSTAEGLMVLLVGGATRANDLVTGLSKEYCVRFRLGEERSTEDFSGEVTFSGPVPLNPEKKIELILPRFLGARLQTPPDISAVWIKGRRAHEIARSGERPEIKPRPVYISSVGHLRDEGDGKTFGLYIKCSRGTYIRSVVRDIGRALGCGAYVLSLVRRSTGSFDLAGASDFRDVESGAFDMADRIRPLSDLASNFYCYRCGPEAALKVQNGRAVPLAELSFLWPGREGSCGEAALLADGLFSYGSIEEGGFFRPSTNIFFGEKQ